MRIELDITPEDRRIAWLATLAIALATAEAALPSPLPGVKPGLANIVTLVVLLRFGLRVAAWVSVLRVVAGGILLGTFLSPGFMLSLAGALAALLSLALTRPLPAAWFGPVTHSVLAALAHMAAQLLLVWLWLLPHAGLAALLPVFAGAALVFGTVNGLIASALLERLKMPRPALP